MTGILRSSSKSMGLTGCGIAENMSLMAMVNNVPLRGDPWEIPLSWVGTWKSCPRILTWNVGSLR